METLPYRILDPSSAKTQTADPTMMLLLLLPPTAAVLFLRITAVAAFVLPTARMYHGPTTAAPSLPFFHVVAPDARPSWLVAARRTIVQLQQQRNNNKNFVDEIVDALDTMAGVSPLSETDLKGDDNDLQERAARRAQEAPPSDALQKPSVSVFFALLGIIPSLLFLYAVQSGAVKPFGL